MNKKCYGWIPDLPDHRDFMYKAIRPKEVAVLPTEVDLRPGCSPVEDQGELGSCTAHAIAGALQYLEIKDKVKYEDFSRLFIYFNERMIEGTTNYDAGASIRDGIKTLLKYGVCGESLWPYNIDNFRKKPPDNCYQDGANHKVTTYSRILTLDQMRNCLAQKFPFVFGFTVYESFESDAVTKTGIVNMPGPDEQPVGGHAVLAVGYFDTSQRFIVRNSWGPDWGMEGYFTIPYSYLTNRNLASDMWTLRRGGLMIERER